MKMPTRRDRTPLRRSTLTTVARCAVLVALVLAATAAWAQPRQPITVVSPRTGRTEPAVPDRVVIVPARGATAAQMQGLLANLGAANVRQLKSGTLIVDLPAGSNVPAAIGAAQAAPGVAVADADYIGRYTDSIPDDTLWSQQYGPQIMHCPAAWDTHKGDGVIVAIIDSGVAYDHPDLAAHMWTNPGEIPGDGIDNDGNGFVDDVYGYDFGNNDGDPHPRTYAAGLDPGGVTHGTHCAGIAAAVTDNAEGIAGVGWNARIMALKIGDDATGDFSWSATWQALEYAADMGADVINFSLAGGYSDTFTPEIEYGYTRGVTICAAAGNEYSEITGSPTTWLSPLCNDGPVLGVDNWILGVAATDSSDVKADFSNYSSALRFVDVAAPGVDVLSTVWPFDTTPYDLMSGTSMACPHAVGAAALLVQKNGVDQPGAVIGDLRDGADNIDSQNPGYIGKLGTGRINVYTSVRLNAPPLPATGVSADDTPGVEAPSCTVDWTPSGDDGAGRNDVVGYAVQRTTNPLAGPWTIVSGVDLLPRGTNTFADTTVAVGTDYFYMVTTWDASQSVDSEVAGPARTRDDVAPDEITTLTAGDTQADDGRSISLQWSGYTAPADFAEYRLYRSTTPFTSVTATGVTRVNTGTVLRTATHRSYDDAANRSDPTSPPLDFTDYYYAVTAVDTSGNESRITQSVGPVQAGPNVILTVAAGLRMIALPADPVPADPLTVFGLTAVGDLQFARYNPTTRAYTILTDANNTDAALALAAGRAFWMNRPSTTFIQAMAARITTPTFDVTSAAGWNQIGNAYAGELDFLALRLVDSGGTVYTPQESKAAGLCTGYAWRWDALSQSYKLLHYLPGIPGVERFLPSGEGMWMDILQTGVKVREAQPAALASAVTGAAAKDNAPAVTESNWAMRLVAEVAGGTDTANFVGVSPHAAELNEIISPPSVGPVDLFFPAAGGAGTRRAASFAAASAGANTQWRFTVDCQAAKQQVTLRWPDLSQMPVSLRPILVDVETGRTVYMRTAASFSYDSGPQGGQRTFELRAAAPTGLVVTTMTAAQAPEGSVVVTYSLTADAAVRMQVTNIAGRPIRSLEQTVTAGTHTMRWDGRDAGGLRAPGGAYLIQLEATAPDGQATTRLQRVDLRR